MVLPTTQCWAGQGQAFRKRSLGCLDMWRCSPMETVAMQPFFLRLHTIKQSVPSLSFSICHRLFYYLVLVLGVHLPRSHELEEKSQTLGAPVPCAQVQRRHLFQVLLHPVCSACKQEFHKAVISLDEKRKKEDEENLLCGQLAHKCVQYFNCHHRIYNAGS